MVLKTLNQIIAAEFRKHAIIHARTHGVARRYGGNGSFHPILQRALAVLGRVAKNEIVGGISR